MGFVMLLGVATLDCAPPLVLQALDHCLNCCTETALSVQHYAFLAIPHVLLPWPIYAWQTGGCSVIAALHLDDFVSNDAPQFVRSAAVQAWCTALHFNTSKATNFHRSSSPAFVGPS